MTINKRLVTSALTIGAAGAMLVGATFAFFSSNATSTANIFSTGTLKLALCDASETCPVGANATQNVTASFGATGLVPGGCTSAQTLTLKNTGSTNGVSVTVSATNTDATLAAKLNITALTYDGSPVVTPPATLAALASGGLNLGGINAGLSKDLVMTVCLDNSAGNTLQGASDTLDLSVTLNQI